MRYKIFKYLRGGKKSVGQIRKILNLSQPITSGNLRDMYSKGIVDYTQFGTAYNYFIAGQWDQESMQLKDINI